MAKMMSVCGVLCSNCPAYQANQKGILHQRRTASAWLRIYGLNEAAENISCGGCLGPDEELFHSSRTCEARRCCLSKGFHSCAQCAETKCPLLEKAQSVWDGVPEIGKTLTREDFVEYAQAYCNHRRRLADVRCAFQSRQH